MFRKIFAKSGADSGKKTKKGSALVFTLIVLAAMLVVSIGSFEVSMLNQKTSTDTEKSISAFQAADSGVEIVNQELNKEIKIGAGGSKLLSEISSVSFCNDANMAEYVDTNFLNGRKLVVQLLAQNKTQLNCGGTNPAKIRDVKYFKSVGEYGGTSRSVLVSFWGDDVKDIMAGNTSSCAVKNDGSLWCWGSNANLVVGLDSYTQHQTADKPVQIRNSQGGSFFEDAKAVWGQSGKKFVLKNDGTLWGWGGMNSYNALGLSSCAAFGCSPTNEPYPKRVFENAGSNFAQVSDGGGNEVSCAVMEDGSLWCVGNNRYGTIGNGSNGNTITVPYRTIASGVKKVAVGVSLEDVCAVKNDGSLWCWGRNSSQEIQPAPFGGNTTTPVQVLDSSWGVKDVSIGSTICVVREDGTVWCWGANACGQVGIGSRTLSAIGRPPQQVIGENGNGFLTDVISLSAGGLFNCALKEDGSVWCWGANFHGSLGDGTSSPTIRTACDGGPTTYKPYPVKVLKINDATGFKGSNGENTCVVRKDESAWCWGANRNYSLGNGTASSTSIPTKVIWY